ncbi:MAG: dipeptide epimerase [Chitinophagaceae bacterium]|nr:dipeptide epimerase [Chitinophagaceae bacterium]
MTATIHSIELYASRIKLIAPFIISLGPLTHAENVIVIINTNEGITGSGECSPFMTINGESMETGMIVGKYLATILKGKNPLDIEACHKSMNSVIYANNSIKSAFDMALYDIAAQHAQLPLYAFLGGSNNKTLITDYTVSFDAAEKMAADAAKIKANGFQVVKVKLGGTKEADIERIRQIRNAIGNELPLRIDANQGWNTNDAIEILKALEPYNIQHCEEPIPRWNFMKLPIIKQQSPIKIMADESCCDDHDAQRLLDIGACDYFNLKLGKSSGIFTAEKIIRIAETNNINIQIGGFLESRLAFTAAAHLALTSDTIVHCDFDTPLMFEEDPVLEGITYDSKGGINVPESIGLGASFDEAYLNKLDKIVV